MAGKPFPKDLLAEAQGVLEAWNQIDKDLKIGDLASSALKADLDQANSTLAQMNALEAQLTDLRNKRDALYQSVWDKVKRARAGVKAIYGDDSSQYEMIGGTRLSERKTPSHKPKA